MMVITTLVLPKISTQSLLTQANISQRQLLVIADQAAAKLCMNYTFYLVIQRILEVTTVLFKVT